MVTVGTVNNTVTGADSSLGCFSQLSLANVQPVLFRLQSVSNVLLESGSWGIHSCATFAYLTIMALRFAHS